ncbi:MAG: DUF4178 domain-containing protein [Myxococcales bacterium]|nr:DUF4178 domain-containing protein [Myxococcales bacterium]
MKLAGGIATVQIPLFTALIIAALILAGAATAVGGGLVIAARKRAALGGGPETELLGSGNGSNLLERSFGDLRVGDVIMYDGADFIVEGLIRYDEAGHHWSMARIVDGSNHCWLLVGLERSGGSSKRILTPTNEVELAGYPPELIMLGDERYDFDKRGTATTALDGDTGSLGGTSQQTSGAAHRCRWWNYSAAGPKALLVEQWGDDYRVLVGTTVSDSEIEMMPGS